VVKLDLSDGKSFEVEGLCQNGVRSLRMEGVEKELVENLIRYVVEWLKVFCNLTEMSSSSHHPRMMLLHRGRSISVLENPHDRPPPLS
jgi:GTP:adenosylcobinamide-phosphate guanylyltransferase